MSSKIEEIITEIEEFIDGCKTQPFSSSKIVVDKTTLEELLLELRRKTPEEIKKYQKIVSNREGILAEAKAQAEAMLSDARSRTDDLINDHVITQQATEQANAILADASQKAQEILDAAVADADSIRQGALSYTDDMLAHLEVVMGQSLETAQAKHNAYMNAIQSSLQVVQENRSELRAADGMEDTSPQPEDPPQPEPEEMELDIPAGVDGE